jgi:hypothetical protein
MIRHRPGKPWRDDRGIIRANRRVGNRETIANDQAASSRSSMCLLPSDPSTRRTWKEGAQRAYFS